jgi:hypothetical protein
MHHPQLALLLVLGTATATTTAATAQTQAPEAPRSQWVLGPRFGYDLDFGGIDVSESFVGLQLNLDTGRRWQPSFSVEVSGRAGPSSYRLNADLRYHLPIAHDMVYLGGGLAVPHLAGGHSPGGNVMVGCEWRRPTALSPFVEAKWVLFSVYTSFNLLTGLTVGF